MAYSIYTGGFNTAYFQREIPVDIVVVSPSTRTLHVGELVTLEPGDADIPAYIYPATGADEATVLANATHIIAQSDMTLGEGHVPVENRDYRYSDAVAATKTGGGVPGLTTPTKHVALFAISESQKYTDVIVRGVTKEG